METKLPEAALAPSSESTAASTAASAAASAAASSQSYAERLALLQRIYYAADKEALARYKVDYPQFWRRDICENCFTTPSTLARVFEKDAVEFLEGLESVFEPIPQERAAVLTRRAVSFGANACLKWLCQRPRPLAEVSSDETEELRCRPKFSSEWSGHRLLVAISARWPLQKLRALVPAVFRDVNSGFPRDMCHSDETWLIFYLLLFDFKLCTEFNSPPQRACWGERGPCAWPTELCTYCMHCIDFRRLEWLIRKAASELKPSVFAQLAPWLLVFRAQLPQLEQAAQAIAETGSEPAADLALFSRLGASSQNIARLAGRLAGGVLWQPAPTETARAGAMALVEFCATGADKPIAESPTALFLAHIVAILYGHSSAAAILAAFRRVDQTLFAFVCNRWEFEPTTVSTFALTQLVSAAAALYGSRCQETEPFIAAVARCLGKHPFRTPVLVAVIEQFGDFSAALATKSAAKPATKSPVSLSSATKPATKPATRRESSCCF